MDWVGVEPTTAAIPGFQEALYDLSKMAAEKGESLDKLQQGRYSTNVTFSIIIIIMNESYYYYYHWQQMVMQKEV
jgi:hypothetical protein